MALFTPLCLEGISFWAPLMRWRRFEKIQETNPLFSTETLSAQFILTAALLLSLSLSAGCEALQRKEPLFPLSSAHSTIWGQISRADRGQYDDVNPDRLPLNSVPSGGMKRTDPGQWVSQVFVPFLLPCVRKTCVKVCVIEHKSQNFTLVVFN